MSRRVGGTGEIDRVTTRREAKQAAAQTSTRWGAIGYHSPVSTAAVLGLRRDGRRRRLETGVGGKKACTRARMYTRRGGAEECRGAPAPKATQGAVEQSQMEGGEKSVMDAQLDADINIDTAEPTTRYVPYTFFVENVLNTLSVVLGHPHRPGIICLADGKRAHHGNPTIKSWHSFAIRFLGGNRCQSVRFAGLSSAERSANQINRK